MRARPGRKPVWYKGKRVREHYSGFEYFEHDGKLFNQEGKLVDRANFDRVTILSRNEQIQRRTR